MGLFDFLAGKPDKDAFARIYMKAARKAGLGEGLTYDRERFAIRTPKEGTVFLANVHAEYCRQARAGRQEVLLHYLELVRARPAPGTPTEAQASLRPMLRPHADFDEMRLEASLAREPVESAIRPWIGGLAIALVQDSERSVSYVSPKQLARWGLTFDEALEIALANLRAVQRVPFKEVAPGFFKSQWKDVYDATRLLTPEVVAWLKVQGRPVAMIPERDHLLVTGDANVAAIRTCLRVSKEILFEAPRPLSSVMLRLEDGAWQPFRPPGDAGIDLDNLQRECLARDYSSQEELLDKLHAQEGRDVLVARLLLRRIKDQPGFRTLAVWGQDHVTLLPKTDELAFIVTRGHPEGHLACRVPWDVAASIVGDMLEPQGLFPERYLVKRFPDETQLAALIAANVSE